ncbi:MAG TPA: hypothetical protein VEQ10_20680 [Vicinamibacteria bacterium]|nr:hypothetical protein [Vicinamibacteria bacterium]
MVPAERMLDDPAGPAAIAWLRRAGLEAPEGAARVLRAIAALAPTRQAFQARLGCVLETLEAVPDADLALVSLERLLHAEGGAEALLAAAALGPDAVAALVWALGGAPFLAEQVIRHPEWVEWLVRPAELRRPQRKGEIAAQARRAASGCGREAARDALRLFRRRQLVLLALRDLRRLSSVAGTLADLSAVARGLLPVALELAASELQDARGRALHDPAAGFAVLALGKLGGGELNYSSDVDLVYVHGGAAGAEAEGRVDALARHLTAVLGEATHEGHVYRVDLRLRPEGRAGALVHSLDSAEDYYRRRGATWERLALLKARAVAGDPAIGREFRRRVAPFVWRRPFDAEAVRQVLRLKQESDRRLAARGLAERHVKLGRGGIREVELVVQVLQIRQGGRLRAPAARNTLFALEALRQAGTLAGAEHDALAAAYLFLRDVENKLQMAHDTQTHVLPADEAGLALLAARMGYRGGRRGRSGAAQELRGALALHTEAVHRIYEDLLFRALRP